MTELTRHITTVYSTRSENLQLDALCEPLFEKRLKRDDNFGEIGFPVLMYKVKETATSTENARFKRLRSEPNYNNAGMVNMHKILERDILPLQALEFAGTLVTKLKMPLQYNTNVLAVAVDGTVCLQVDYNLAKSQHWYAGCHLYCTYLPSNMYFEYGEEYGPVTPVGFEIVTDELRTTARNAKRNKKLEVLFIDFSAGSPTINLKQIGEKIFNHLKRVIPNLPSDMTYENVITSGNKYYICDIDKVNTLIGNKLNTIEYKQWISPNMNFTATRVLKRDLHSKYDPEELGLIFVLWAAFIYNKDGTNPTKIPVPDFSSYTGTAKADYEAEIESQFPNYSTMNDTDAIITNKNEKKFAQAYGNFIKNDPVLCLYLGLTPHETPVLKVQKLYLDHDEKTARIAADLMR